MDLTMLERLRIEAAAAARDSDRTAHLDRFRSLVTRVEVLAHGEDATAATRAKARAFLKLLDAAYARLGASLFQPSYLLNVVGDAMVRARLIAEPIVDFIQVGLYFHGIRQIERRFAGRAAGYLATHADLITAYVSRASLKQIIEDGRAKVEGGRVFCLTYHYLNALKKAYFNDRRASQDALDHLVADGQAAETARDQHEPNVDPSDRIGLMLDIFARKLTATQQRVYLAKNRLAQETAGLMAMDIPAFQPFRTLFQELNGELDGHGNLGWSEIAARLSVNEKTAKREYVRALHTLLRETAQAVFGINITSNYVRRVLEQLRHVVDAKDLRIRDATGDGLPRLVEKWEVALRFVLNHERALA